MVQIFQGFGELFLDEMTNELSVAILIVSFIFLNVVLLNLLIAMMSGTYERVSRQANRQTMLEKYAQIKAHCRTALAAPPFINIPYIILVVFQFFCNYQSLRRRFVGVNFRELLDIYLSRHSDEILSADNGSTADDRSDALRLQSFMERAKHTYLDRVEANSQHEVDRLQKKMDHLNMKLERHVAQLEHSLSSAFCGLNKKIDSALKGNPEA